MANDLTLTAAAGSLTNLGSSDLSYLATHDNVLPYQDLIN